MPTLLAESGYSRRFEEEADLGAADYMIQRGWGVAPLCEILQRIDPELSPHQELTEMISTHPLTEKRLQIMRDQENGIGDGRTFFERLFAF